MLRTYMGRLKITFNSIVGTCIQYLYFIFYKYEYIHRYRYLIPLFVPHTKLSIHPNSIYYLCTQWTTNPYIILIHIPTHTVTHFPNSFSEIIYYIFIDYVFRMREYDVCAVCVYLFIRMWICIKQKQNKAQYTAEPKRRWWIKKKSQTCERNKLEKLSSVWCMCIVSIHIKKENKILWMYE